MSVESAVYGEISFDTINLRDDHDHMEGCYRVSGGDWRVFYFTHRRNGGIWEGEPDICEDGVFQSGIHGIDAVFPRRIALNNESVIGIVRRITGIEDWKVVAGPDSLTLK